MVYAGRTDEFGYIYDDQLKAPTEFISTKRVTAEPFTKDHVQGMQLVYADGYVSWCPMNVFERDYEAIGAMSFGHALFAMEQGARVCRQGWNGKGMWICIGQGGLTDARNFWNEHTKAFAEANGGSAEVLPYLIMKTADNKILMGWLASQSDMLAHDWMVLA